MAMLWSFGVSTVAVLWLSTLLSAQTGIVSTLYETANQSTAHRAVLLAQSEFTRVDLTRLCTAFAASNKNRKVAKLSIFTTRRDAIRTLIGKGTDHITLGAVADAIRREYETVPAMADCIM